MIYQSGPAEANQVGAAQKTQIQANQRYKGVLRFVQTSKMNVKCGKFCNLAQIRSHGDHSGTDDHSGSEKYKINKQINKQEKRT